MKSENPNVTVHKSETEELSKTELNLGSYSKTHQSVSLKAHQMRRRLLIGLIRDV